jgi:hypothetical protein
MKMEQIECSKTSAYKIQTTGNHPEENIQHTEQGESLKSKILFPYLFFNIHGSLHHNNILIYIQQDAMLNSLFYPETALHVLGGTSTHHQEHKQLYLQHLVFVTSLLLSAAIVEELEPV